MNCHLRVFSIGPKHNTPAWGKEPIAVGDVNFWSVEKVTASCLDGLQTRVMSHLGITANKGNADTFEMW